MGHHSHHPAHAHAHRPGGCCGTCTAPWAISCASTCSRSASCTARRSSALRARPVPLRSTRVNMKRIGCISLRRGVGGCSHSGFPFADALLAAPAKACVHCLRVLIGSCQSAPRCPPVVRSLAGARCSVYGLASRARLQHCCRARSAPATSSRAPRAGSCACSPAPPPRARTRVRTPHCVAPRGAEIVAPRGST